MTADVVPLDPDEETVWSGRPRLATVLPEAGVGLVVVAASIGATIAFEEPTLALVGLAGLIPPVRKVLVVTNMAFLVTDRACYRKTGVLSRQVRRIGFDRVQNSAFRQSFRGSLLGYGTVVIEAAGGGRVRFDAVEDPQAVRSLVDSRVGRVEIPGSVARWETILEEVRALRAALVEG